MARPVEIDELFPAEAGIDAEEVLAASTDDLESDLTEEDVEVVDPVSPPAGRTWSFNFQTGRFNMNGQAPASLNEDAAIMSWIEKCLMTAENAAAVHPPGYGLPKPITDYLGNNPYDIEEIQSDIEEALTFHPSITGVSDFDLTFGPTVDGDMAAEISFLAQVNGESLPFEMEVSV